MILTNLKQIWIYRLILCWLQCTCITQFLCRSLKCEVKFFIKPKLLQICTLVSPVCDKQFHIGRYVARLLFSGFIVSSSPISMCHAMYLKSKDWKNYIRGLSLPKMCDWLIDVYVRHYLMSAHTASCLGACKHVLCCLKRKCIGSRCDCFWTMGYLVKIPGKVWLKWVIVDEWTAMRSLSWCK